ncbi:pimeloyl-CoA dehydrogenase large subunit [Chromatiales bacterium (ex Bugula neritina AB1)]|nr:pimeloyl-CoA dehydrogenase large subunit [Chromatiales bacterium (ex Bugula neritina AB1)]
MDLNYSPEDISFRDNVRRFISERVPQQLKNNVLAGKHLSKADMQGYHNLLNEQGWLAQSWPEEYGGCAWSAVQKHIFDEESAAAGCPRIIPFGVNMLGPVLLKFGDEAQRRHYLPRILDGTDWWCQGYSEPGAGSDLASLKTRAVRDGNRYIVNGQKTWTTFGQHADWIFCLVRTGTEGKPQQGISFLLIDMKSPGIEVRPIKLLNGTSTEVNEIFFDNVEVPPENLVGQENHGWTYAKHLLTHERTGIAGVGFAINNLNQLKAIARQQYTNGKPLIEDPLFAARIASVEIDLEAMKTTNLRVVAAASQNAAPGPESSMLKIKGTVIRQEINDLMRRALGPDAVPYLEDYFEPGYSGELPAPDYAMPVASHHFNERKISIYGGSNEIQRGIISKMILGL